MIINANATHIPLADNSVQCVVTSPPYWGLRDYGTARWEGGDEGCDHKIPAYLLGGGTNKSHAGSFTANHREQCKCGAIRIDKQIGLESTPELYVEHIVAVFREVKRVLRDDGTVWLNLGDSYSGSWGNYHPNSPPGKHGQRLKETARWNRPAYSQEFLPPTANCGLKPKDLVGIPWRVAFALQADGAASPATMLAVDRIRTALLADFDSWDQVPDKTRNTIEALDREWSDAHRGGWYLRSDIIWAKPNPMPESVTDRPTKAHEYIFLLTKNERYYYDQDAVREPSCDPPGTHRGGALIRAANGGGRDDTGKVAWEHHGGGMESLLSTGYRNLRTVWNIATQPYPDAHFATFPEEIAKRCIMAGTSEKGACGWITTQLRECGAPWDRVVEKVFKGDGNPYSYRERSVVGSKMKLSGQQLAQWKFDNPDKTLGWQPTCTHDAPTTACVVLDPFCGSGTVVQVAQDLGRHGIGLDINSQYLTMAKRRTAQMGLSLEACWRSA